MAIISSFSAAWGSFVTLGDGADDNIVIGRNAAGALLVNGGVVAINGGVPTLANVRLMQLLGQGGNDVLSLDESGGPLPAALLSGGDGNDDLSGGSSNDTLRGGTGGDTLQGRGGNDQMFGDAGDDVLNGGDGDDRLSGDDGNDLVVGGRGNDSAQLGNGDDRFTWSPGDGSDVIDGQGGFDTHAFNGSNGNETFNISASGTHVRLLRDVANIVMDQTGVERIELRTLGGTDTIHVGHLAGTDLRQLQIDLQLSGGGGDGAADTVTQSASGSDDVVTVSSSTAGDEVLVQGLTTQLQLLGFEAANDLLRVDGLAGADTLDATLATVRLQLSGGDGADRLLGGTGNDLLLGDNDNDTVVGGRGNDVALLGSGDDRFTWNPGDGNDVIEGQDGFDTHVFNGSNASETIDISANGARVLLHRDVGNITMDQSGVESIELAALGGSDRITVGDLAGTDVQQLTLRLGGPAGGGDGAADTVAVQGSAGDDAITVVAGGGSATVTGMGRQVQVTDLEAGSDQLRIEGQGGADVINATASTTALQLLGGEGADLLLGGAGNDGITGGRGNDTALMGPGDDRFTWNPGDGSDIIEGQSGFDTQVFNGANIGELITIGANGGRVLLTRDVANITMDQNDVERIELATLGGSDRITLNDLTGTDLVEVAIDLRAAGGGGGDGAVDTVTVNGTAGDDVVVVTMQGSDLVVTGLASTVVLHGFEPGIDRLVIQALGGDDVIEGSAATVPLELFGGDGNDILLGGSGNDQLFGEAGDDILIGGDGLDVLVGGPGDNVLIQ